VDSGRILIAAGHRLGVARLAAGQIAYVGQVVQLFRGSIRENIGLGRIGASEAEIVAAAKAAHAHELS